MPLSADDLARLSTALRPQWRVERALDATVFGPALAVSGAEVDGVRGDQPGTLYLLGPEPRREVRDAEAFLRALERAERVRHEAFPSLLGDGAMPDGSLYFVTEPAEGTVVAERIARGDLLGAAEVGAVGAALADGLEAAHAAGVRHGGIAPTQLLLGERGARLIGFGVYEALVAGGVEPYRAAALMGLRQHASPEQLAGATLDGRSDVYALGATLFEMLTGKPPFGGRATMTVMASVLGDEAAPAGVRGAQSPGPVVDALLRAIERDPTDRWPSAAAFAAALRRVPGERRMAARTPARGKAGCAAAIVLAAAGVAMAAALGALGAAR